MAGLIRLDWLGLSRFVPLYAYTYSGFVLDRELVIL